MEDFVIKQLPLSSGAMVERLVDVLPEGWGSVCGGEYTVYGSRNKKEDSEKPYCGLRFARSNFGVDGHCSETDFGISIRQVTQGNIPDCPVLELEVLRGDPDGAWAARGLQRKIEEWHDVAKYHTADSRTLLLKEE